MKPRLLILSDLWGIQKSDWIRYYTTELKDSFELQYYDCCKLGELNISPYTEENLHQQFVQRGIKLAVENLGKLEQGKVNILAFSIGGVIGWKWAVNNPNAISLYAVSSTRLRYETSKPSGRIELYFGEEDPYKPKNEWFIKMNLDIYFENKKTHQIYMTPEFAKTLCKRITKHSVI